MFLKTKISLIWLWHHGIKFFEFREAEVEGFIAIKNF